jgi:hypothetical protein
MATSEQQDRPTRTPKKSGTPGARAPDRKPAPRRLTAAAVASRAAGQLLDLTGRAPEGVTGLSRTDDGWTVQVEVLEARRIPDTTDLLALYDVEVDTDGEMVGYRRVRRYVRGKPDEGS